MESLSRHLQPSGYSRLRALAKADAGVQTNGTLVSGWADQSGRGHDAMPAMASNYPTYVSSAVNGLPAVRFDGIHNSMVFTSVAARTVFFVCLADDSANDLGVIVGRGSDYDGIRRSYDNAWRVPGNDNDFTYPAGSRFRVNGLTATGAVENVWHMVEAVRGGSAMSVDRVGGNYGGRKFPGNVAEVIIYDQPLNDAQCARVGRYLTKKYGLNTSYNSQSVGKSHIWVKVPLLTQSASIWACWGNPAATTQPAYCTNGSTWSEGYIGVWHLHADEKDSTANGYNGTNVNATNAVGTIAGAYDFDGSGENYVDFGDINAVDGASRLTVDMWARSSDTGDGDLMTKCSHSQIL